MKKQLLKLVSFLFLFTFVATNYLLSEIILISDNIKIIDGETILLDNKKILITGIDAPETKFKGSISNHSIEQLSSSNNSQAAAISHI